jgi:hypothetical protein
MPSWLCCFWVHGEAEHYSGMAWQSKVTHLLVVRKRERERMQMSVLGGFLLLSFLLCLGPQPIG